MPLGRVGARVLITLGLAVSALGMTDFTYISVDGNYATQVLPGLLVLGMGIGLVFAPAMQSAVTGVEARDAGVASAMVNTMQQVGGSIGVALLGTVAGNATSSYLDGKGALTPELLAQATVHSYTTTFWWAAGIFAVGAVSRRRAAEVRRPGHGARRGCGGCAAPRADVRALTHS